MLKCLKYEQLNSDKKISLISPEIYQKLMKESEINYNKTVLYKFKIYKIKINYPLIINKSCLTDFNLMNVLLSF